MSSQTSDEGSPLTKGEVAPAISTSDDVIGPEMTAIETVVKQLHLDSWQVDNTQQVKYFAHIYIVVYVLMVVCNKSFYCCLYMNSSSRGCQRLSITSTRQKRASTSKLLPPHKPLLPIGTCIAHIS